MAKRPEDLTVDYKRLMKMTVSQRVSMARSPAGVSYLASLSPSQYASLFPNYYKKSVPSFASIQSVMSGGADVGSPAPTTGGGGGGGGGQSAAGTTYTPPQQSSVVRPPWMQKFEQEVQTKTGGIATDAQGVARTPGGVDRSKFFNEMKDPQVRELFYTMMDAEVGSMGKQAHIGFAETVFNRAQYEGKTLKQILSNRNYYQPYKDGGFSRAQKRMNDDLRAQYSSVLDNVGIGGSDTTNGASHNASGSVARNAVSKYDAVPESIINIGGETYYSKTFEQKQRRKLPRISEDFPSPSTTQDATGVQQQGPGETGVIMPGGKPSLGPGKDGDVPPVPEGGPKIEPNERQKPFVGYETMDPKEFWAQRNSNNANIKDVDPRLLRIRMMAAIKFEEENPGKKVEIYGPASGKRGTSQTTGSQHLSGRALDLAIYEVGANGEKINMGGAYGNYPNFGTEKHGGMEGTAKAAHLYDRLNEYDELARVYMKDVVGDNSYGFGIRIGTYFSGKYFTDQMHVDIGGELDKQGLSVGGTAAGSVAYGMAENYLKQMGISPNSPEGKELLTGVLEKYGGTKEGVVAAAKEAFGGGASTVVPPEEYYNLPEPLRKEIEGMSVSDKNHLFGLMDKAKRAGIDPVQGLTRSYEQAQKDAKTVATAITEAPPGQIPSAFSGDIIGSMENITDPRYRDPQGGTTESEFSLGEGKTFNYAESKEGQKELGQFGNVKLTTIVTDKGTKVAVNAAIANDARGLLNEMEQRGYNIEDVSSYNPRSKRGSSSPSMHGWAAALDFNPDKNPFSKWKSYEPGKTDMPENMKYLFMKYGFAQIGSDRMHIERVNPSKRKAYLEYLLKEGIIPKNDPYVQAKVNEGLLTDEFMKLIPEPPTATPTQQATEQAPVENVPTTPSEEEVPFPTVSSDATGVIEGPNQTGQIMPEPTLGPTSNVPEQSRAAQVEQSTSYEIAGQPVQEGQALTQEQMQAIGIARSMDEKNYQNYPEHVRRQYEKQLNTPTPTQTAPEPTTENKVKTIKDSKQDNAVIVDTETNKPLSTINTEKESAQITNDSIKVVRQETQTAPEPTATPTPDATAKPVAVNAMGGEVATPKGTAESIAVYPITDKTRQTATYDSSTPIEISNTSDAALLPEPKVNTEDLMPPTNEGQNEDNMAPVEPSAPQQLTTPASMNQKTTPAPKMVSVYPDMVRGHPIPASEHRSYGTSHINRQGVRFNTA